PRGGVGQYSKAGGPLHDTASDDAFFAYLSEHLPESIEVIDCEEYIEDKAFVRRAVDLLIGLIEQESNQ
ncbi:MAG: Tm-1-like ATP-binding domain-containing protein, partial [Saprospiraceae bacterium]|nr:Tm-1-like ATP-binding domain-containing protein [Saprospiraceae bacterium]